MFMLICDTCAEMSSYALYLGNIYGKPDIFGKKIERFSQFMLFVFWKVNETNGRGEGGVASRLCRVNESLCWWFCLRRAAPKLG